MKRIYKTERHYHTCDICGEHVEKHEDDYDELQNHCKFCGRDMCWQCNTVLFRDILSCKECATLLKSLSEQATAIMNEYEKKILSLMNERQGKILDIMNQMKTVIKEANKNGEIKEAEQRLGDE